MKTQRMLIALIAAATMGITAPGEAQETTARPTGPILHRAAPGDSLASLSAKHSIPVETLASNSFLEPNARLVPGEIVLLLAEKIDFENLGADFIKPALIDDAQLTDLDGDPEQEIGIIGSSWERDRTQQLIFVERRQRQWKAVMVYQVRQESDPCRISFSVLVGTRPQVVISGREGVRTASCKELYTIILAWTGREGREIFRELEYSLLEPDAWGQRRLVESEFAIADRDHDGAPEIERSVHDRIEGLGVEKGVVRYEDRSRESFHWDPRQKTFYPVEQEVPKLDSTSRAIRLRAVERLGAAGSRAPATALERFLTDPAPELQRAAAQTLGMIGSRSSLEPILDRLKQIPPAELACDLLEALGEIGDPRGAEAVRFWMEHKEIFVRGYAHVAGSQLGMDVSLAALVDCLQDDQPDQLRMLALKELTRRTGEDFGTEWATFKDFGAAVQRCRDWWRARQEQR
ncbi:MAG: HEAT repeat domain-containing protein [Phycisphaeraceae bacterium]|nr:HEAT repeat domain-containing protein [Phycisphaeraceae bacterium]